MMSHKAKTREGERVSWEIASRSKERDGFMQKSSGGLLPTKAANSRARDEVIAASCCRATLRPALAPKIENTAALSRL